MLLLPLRSLVCLLPLLLLRSSVGLRGVPPTGPPYRLGGLSSSRYTLTFLDGVVGATLLVRGALVDGYVCGNGSPGFDVGTGSTDDGEAPWPGFGVPSHDFLFIIRPKTPTMSAASSYCSSDMPASSPSRSERIALLASDLEPS